MKIKIKPCWILKPLDFLYRLYLKDKDPMTTLILVLGTIVLFDGIWSLF